MDEEVISLKITALAENTSCRPDIGCEHGLSLFIETNTHRVLFDTGQSALFAENAEKLGVDLTKADFAVLSHGHYDHGGGLARFLELNPTAPVYLNRHAFEPHYNGTEKYIGLDPALQKSNRLIITDEEYRIADGLTLFACNGREKTSDFGSGNLNVLENGKLIAEDFRHEHYLLIEENGRRVLISGCSHKGILNIVEWFRPDYLIGGFHMMKLDCGERLREYAEQLNNYDTEYYTCHCTGEAQYAFLSGIIRRLHYLSAGQIVEI